MKQKAVTLALLILLGTALLFTSSASPQVSGQSPYGLMIFYVTAQGSFEQLQNATVGQPVTLLASTDTYNGTYNLYYDDQLVSSGTSEGYFVSANFTIPEITTGTYNLTLTDVAYGQNTSIAFPILTAYSIKPIIPSAPSVLQEGNRVPLNVTITGGEPNTSYNAEITVTLPPDLGTNFTKTVTLTTSSKGTAQTTVNYPDTTFSPSGATTNYAGTYTAYFNRTQNLAQQAFKIGFTDLTQYHREDNVKINAVGYQPNQGATIAIQYNNSILSSQTVTASAQGIINATYQIPVNAELGTYTVTITPTITPSKNIADVQTFDVVGYPVTLTTVNLAGDLVSGILLEAIDVDGSGVVYSNTTNSNGEATISLEKGDVTVNAYWNQVNVGTLDLTVTGSSRNAVTCELTNLKVTVQNNNGVVIPFTNLNITYNYVTRSGSTQTATASGQTDLSGTYTFNSTLPHVNYNIEAEKYDTVFNSGNNTLTNPPAQDTVMVTILCPDKTLTLNVVDNNNAAIPDVRITFIEQESGIFYSENTNSNGNVQLQVTFGQYRLNVYTSNNVLINETIISVLSNTNSQIRCALSNLDVSVKVVDYFGNPINNVDVQLIRTGMNTQTATTQNDGLATFNSILGGNLEITASPAGNPTSFVASNVEVNSPTTVTLTMGKYVVFGGALVDASLLTTVLLIIAAILVVGVLEVLRRVSFRLSRASP
ncbi:MAG: hypothetical protein ACBZ72_11570 [Candidatus Bathyarchaeia archaeon]|jgi:hypothetical protein